MDGGHGGAGDDDRQRAVRSEQRPGAELRVQRGRGGRASSAGWTRASGPPVRARMRTPDLADGSHTFQVRATDRAGNAGGAASHAWTVDTVAPDTTIDAAPSNPSNDRSPSFEFSADEAASFECRLDAGAWAACTSPHAYAGLADGSHTFQARATDRAGNAEAVPASYTWTIEPPPDNTPPTTTLTGQPTNPSNDASATFSFTGSDNETPQSMIVFQCRVDGGAFAACALAAHHGRSGRRLAHLRGAGGRPRRERRRDARELHVDGRHDGSGDDHHGGSGRADGRFDADVLVLERGGRELPVPRRQRRLRGLQVAAYDGRCWRTVRTRSRCGPATRRATPTPALPAGRSRSTRWRRRRRSRRVRLG